MTLTFHFLSRPLPPSPSTVCRPGYGGATCAGEHTRSLPALITTCQGEQSPGFYAGLAAQSCAGQDCVGQLCMPMPLGARMPPPAPTTQGSCFNQHGSGQHAVLLAHVPQSVPRTRIRRVATQLCRPRSAPSAQLVRTNCPCAAEGAPLLALAPGLNMKQPTNQTSVPRHGDSSDGNATCVCVLTSLRATGVTTAGTGSVGTSACSVGEFAACAARHTACGRVE